jgi:cyanophycinase
VTVFLVGGGPETVLPGLLAPFLAEAAAGGRRSRLALVVVGPRHSRRRLLPPYLHALDAGRDVEVQLHVLGRGEVLAPGVLSAADGIAVGGGPTPAYLDGLAGAAGGIGAQVRAGTPYLGFSAGAMVAPATALAGGCRSAGRDVCPEEHGEDLEEVTVRPGLGLVGFPVDVHTAQAGTLGRTVAVVEAGAAPVAVGIDEDTCLALPAGSADPAEGVVTGRGGIWVVRGSAGGTAVTRRTAG